MSRVASSTTLTRILCQGANLLEEGAAQHRPEEGVAGTVAEEEVGAAPVQVAQSKVLVLGLAARGQAGGSGPASETARRLY